VHCVYVASTGYCSSSFAPCSRAQDCEFYADGESCEVACGETDFSLRLTPSQPIAWRVGEGLFQFPCSDTPCGEPPEFGQGIVPPSSGDPFVGTLVCVAVDSEGRPAERNDLLGRATIERHQTSGTPTLDAAGYNAVGLQAISGAGNGDSILALGGPDPEYEGCSAVPLLDHFFEGAVDPARGTAEVDTVLALVPCSWNFEAQQTPSVFVHYLVFNEFEQRLLTSKRMTCRQAGPLSEIDPTVFDVGVQGTLAGQTRMLGVGAGVVGVALERQRDLAEPTRIRSAASDLHGQGDRPDADLIVLPGVP